MAVIIAVIGFGTMAERARHKTLEAETYETAQVAPEIGSSETFFIGSSGSALASAAFGLSALQPETYNGEIVLDIIDASPLESAEKQRLAAKLDAAEMGYADLNLVLSDVRVSLAVE